MQLLLAVQGLPCSVKPAALSPQNPACHSGGLWADFFLGKKKKKKQTTPHPQTIVINLQCNVIVHEIFCYLLCYYNRELMNSAVQSSWVENLFFYSELVSICWTNLSV